VERRPLGDSGIDVSVLSFGAMTFSPQRQAIARVDEDTAHRMVHRVLDAGVNLVDTADAYDDGRSEEILGRAIRGRRDEVVIATKWGSGRTGGRAVSPTTGWSPRARRVSGASTWT
jgi:aryl-alcohol dehydrogenase-like predicted oxidoreductase